MVQAIKKVLRASCLPALFSMLLTGCFERGSDGCTDTYVLVPFSEEYKAWFKQAGQNYTTMSVPVQTAAGLKETIALSKLDHHEGVLQPTKDCIHISGQTVGLGYNSSLYGLGLSLSLLQQTEGEKPVLRLNNYYQEGDDYLFSQTLVSLGGSTTYPLTLTRTRQGQPSENIQTNAFPELSVVDSVVVGSKIYRQVYKISNPYLKREGRDFFVTDFFIHKDYGLVQYAQQDGTVWQLQF